MTTVSVIGIVIALALIMVYIVRSWGSAEKEKATSDAVSKMAQERTRILEQERLAQEYEKRKNETVPQVPRDDPGVRFYPERLLPDKDPDDLN